MPTAQRLEEIQADRATLIQALKPSLKLGSADGLRSIKVRDIATLCELDLEEIRAGRQPTGEKTESELRLERAREEKARLQAEIEEREIERLKAEVAADKPEAKPAKK